MKGSTLCVGADVHLDKITFLARKQQQLELTSALLFYKTTRL